jgi:predicted ATPase/DNA-binding SARP family transcriptional activator
MLTELWRIELFGGLRAQQSQRELIRFRTQKTGLLLAYLACYPNRAPTRDEIVERLWPEAEPEAGRVNLRGALAALRRQLKHPGTSTAGLFLTDYNTVCLNSAAFTTDVDEFEQALKRAAGMAHPDATEAQLRRAVELYRGELLAGYAAEWITPLRVHLVTDCCAALARLATAAEQRGDLHCAIEDTRRALAIDLSQEPTHCELMRLYLTAGQNAAAQRQYRVLERVLRSQLDLTPSAEARELMRQARRKQITTASFPGSAQPEPSPILSIIAQSTSREAVPLPRLPLAWTRFFGRQEEIMFLTALLEQTLPGQNPMLVSERPSARLITLIGPGGCGKTRLALEVAQQVQACFAGAVCFVSLAELSHTQSLADRLLNALELRPMPALDPLNQIVEYLSQRSWLLVLDNCEHLANAVAAVVQWLLERVPTLCCLTTSRQLLDLDGEHEIAVTPLPLPRVPPDHAEAASNSLASLLDYPGVQLFVDRAQAARPDFQLTVRNANDIVLLCNRLEGIPLALELAAAWAQVLTPAQMLTQLEDRYRFLVSRRRSKAPRHQSLQAAVEWSYRMLEPAQQRLFCQLSVFRGGWTLEAAIAVCEEPEALTILRHLRACSFITAEEIEEEMRYRMLETFREYGVSQLTEEERRGLRRRHLIYFSDVAQRIYYDLFQAEQVRLLHYLDREIHNYRAAQEWCLNNRLHTESGLAMAPTLGFFWRARGRLSEGRHFLSRLLSRPEVQSPTAGKAEALQWMGILANQQGDYAVAEERLWESVQTWRYVGDKVRMAYALYDLAVIALEQEQYAMVHTICEESLTAWPITELVNLVLAEVALEEGDIARAIELVQESLARYRAGGSPMRIGQFLMILGNATCRQDDTAAADDYYKGSLSHFCDVGSNQDIVRLLWRFAALAVAQGRTERAARLFGTATVQRNLLGLRWSPREQRHYEQALALCRSAMPEPDYAVAWQEGASRSLEQAIAYALHK